MLMLLAGGWPQGFTRRTYIRDLNERQKDLLERCGLRIRFGGHNVIDFSIIPGGNGSSMIKVHRDDHGQMREAAERN